jgi:hypothetical protein
MLKFFEQMKYIGEYRTYTIVITQFRWPGNSEYGQLFS